MKTAKAFIFEYGIRGWNMDEFAKEVGITKRTLYKYMNSKESLIEAALVDYIKETQKELADQLNHTADFNSGIHIILHIFPELVTKMQSKIIKDIYKHYPSIEKTIFQKREEFSYEIIKFIQKGKTLGIVRTEIKDMAIVEAVQAFILYYAKNNPDTLSIKLRESIDLLLNGIIQGDKNNVNV
ncbi:TetR/AcrR family transcriptional regulator [Vallitalea pronyensis]|uniref:TetR/AcrR family transcriptional regulator n=1 Tax=Vallitalea pronyensis TaxID=1348613 RepID=A0A8J8SJ52_9FIRM|nr:TetR/AcrR family transcriptional regulator [Vallitalea pronyensis]QUI25301.1 TetR/AcrR family transcriptional regulator [Vallitalea pronyensis]